MAKHVQHILQDPGEAAEHVGFEAEIIIERGTYLMRVHDGITPGGYLTLTLTTAEALFVLQTDFEQEIEQILFDLQEETDAALAAILANVLISRGPVEDIVAVPPVTPATGDRFLLVGALGGVFVGHTNEVVEYIDASTPVFSGPPSEGHEVYVQDENKKYYFDGSVWTTTNPDAGLSDALALKADLISPAFTGVPTAPTPAADDASTKVATTAYVQTELAALAVAVDADLAALDFTAVGGINGYTKLPNGIIMQWCQGVDEAADDTQNTQTVNFPLAFPAACFHAQVTSRIAGTSMNVDSWYQIVGTPTTAGVTVQRQHGEGGIYSGSVTKPFVFAIGN